MAEPVALLDLGGVLVRLRIDRGLRRLAELAGDGAAAGADAAVAAAQAYIAEQALAYNRGAVGPKAFFDGLARALGRTDLAFEACAAVWCEIFDPYPEMEALTAELLAAGHRAYILSNTDPIHFAHLEPRVPTLRRATGLHLSYAVGLAKPDPAYFRAALARFDLAPDRCAFLDDTLANVEAARALGIPSLLHEGDVAEARAFLRARGFRLPDAGGGG